MAIALRAAGAWAAGSTAPAPTIPAGTTTGDIMLLYIGCKPFSSTINAIGGWTLVSGSDGTNGSVNSGIDTGSVKWACFYREWQSGDANPSISITSANVSLAVIKSYSKAAGNTWAVPAGAKGSDTSSGTGFSLTMDADPGITLDDMLDTFSTIAGNNATFGTPTLTATGATIATPTESPTTEGSTATGHDLESSASHALCTAGTATAAPVVGWTLSAAQTGGGAIVRLREVVPSNVTVLPGFGELTLTGFEPVAAVSDNKIVSAGVGALDLTGFAPTVLVGLNVLVGVGALDLTGFAPTVVVSQNVTVATGVGALDLTGFAPSPIIFVTQGAPFLYTSANWSGALFYLEVFFRATTGTVYAQLVADDGVVIANSLLTTTATTFQRSRSAALSLADGKAYRVQFGKSGADAGEFLSGKIVAKLS